jgi:gas vesicle protein
MKNIGKKIKKKDMENDRSSIIGFALAGLAVGAAAWYLFGTKEGRENFDRAIDGINDVSSKLQKKAKEKMEYASDKIKDRVDSASNVVEKVKDKAGSFREKFHDASDEAKEKGQQLAKDAKDLANKAAHSTNDFVDETQAKSKKYTT